MHIAVMRDIPQRVLSLLAPHYLALHEDGSPRYAYTSAYLGTHVRAAALAAALHLDPPALLTQLLSAAKELGAPPQQVSMVSVVADMIEGTAAPGVTGGVAARPQWDRLQSLVWPLRTMSSVHGVRLSHIWPARPVSSDAASAMLDTIPDRVKAMLMPGALPAALANARVASVAMATADVSLPPTMSLCDFERGLNILEPDVRNRYLEDGRQTVGMLHGLAEAVHQSSLSITAVQALGGAPSNWAEELMCNIMAMTSAGDMLHEADPFCQLWPCSMPAAVADAVSQEMIVPGMNDAGCGPRSLKCNINPGTRVQGLVWTQDSHRRMPVVFLQVSYRGKSVSALFWVAKDQAATILSRSTCEALGLGNTVPGFVSHTPEPAFKVTIQGAEEAAWAAVPPLDNINVLGAMPAAPGSRRWQWRVKVRGSHVSVWAEQDPAWQQG